MSIHDFEKPSLTTDMVLFRIGTRESDSKRRTDRKQLEIMLVKRVEDPQKGSLSLPGGFVNIDEDISDSVLRKLKEKAGVTGNFYMEQLYTKGEINRDPRGRVISVSYLGLCNEETYNDKSHLIPEAGWYNVKDVLENEELAFDHKEIIEYALKRLKNKTNYTGIALNLLPHEFTMAECQAVYEILLDVDEVYNIRRTVGKFVKQLESKSEGKQYRPAALFTVNKDVEQNY